MKLGSVYIYMGVIRIKYLKFNLEPLKKGQLNIIKSIYMF